LPDDNSRSSTDDQMRKKSWPRTLKHA